MSIKLQPNYFYHIYNQANGNENLFINDENYNYFLNRFFEFISPIAEIYAYCLMPNHFHFLIKIKEEESIEKLKSLKDSQTNISNEFYLSRQFSNFFNAYTKAFNKVFKRRGSLFQQNFKRKQIDSDEYFTKIIHYIHANPVHHGFVKSIEEWQYSSYNSIMNGHTNYLKSKEVLDWFNGLNEYIAYHKQPISIKSDLK